MAIRLQKSGLEGVYGHITEYYTNKEGTRAQFPVKWYQEESKEIEIDPKYHGLKSRYDYDISVEKATDLIEKIAYDKLGEELKADNFLPEGDSTGEWVSI